MTTKKKAVMKREYGNLRLSENLIPIKGRWVLRTLEGDYIDHDKYRHDLKARHEDRYDIETITEE